MPSGVIGAVGSIGGALLGSKSSKGAADAQQASADAAVAEQRRQFDITQQNQAPYLRTGTAANDRLAYLMGLNPMGASAGAAAAPSPAANGFQPSAPASSGKNVYNTQGHMWLPGTGWIWPNASGWIQPTQSNAIVNAKDSRELSKFQSFVPGWVSTGNNTVYGAGEQYLAQNAASLTAPAAAPAAPASGPAPANPNDPAFGSLAKPFGMSDFQTDPGYGFRMDEGMKAIERSASAKGGLMSGAALKAITRFGQDTASNEYGTAYNRFNTNQTNLYNRLAGLSGTGQTSANTLATTGANTANSISDLLTGGGNAQAAGQIGSANAWATGLNNAARGFGSNNGLLLNPQADSSLPWSTGFRGY